MLVKRRAVSALEQPAVELVAADGVLPGGKFELEVLLMFTRRLVWGGEPVRIGADLHPPSQVFYHLGRDPAGAGFRQPREGRSWSRMAQYDIVLLQAPGTGRAAWPAANDQNIGVDHGIS